MKEFTIMDEGEEKTVAHATWIHPEMLDRLNPEKEIFVCIAIEGNRAWFRSWVLGKRYDQFAACSLYAQ